MADDRDDLGRRLDRIEHALRRPPDGPSRPPAGPEIRSARSIVNRVDDVWVAVTEGNERLVTAVDGLRSELSRLAAALLPDDPPGDPTTDGDTAAEEPGGPLDQPDSGKHGPVGAPEPEPDLGVHLRLNRVEEALAGIAGRLEELAAARHTADDAKVDGGGPQAQQALDALGGDVRGLATRVEGLALALEASAARGADGTLADRLGRLRDQFRR